MCPHMLKTGLGWSALLLYFAAHSRIGGEVLGACSVGGRCLSVLSLRTSVFHEFVLEDSFSHASRKHFQVLKLICIRDSLAVCSRVEKTSPAGCLLGIHGDAIVPELRTYRLKTLGCSAEASGCSHKECILPMLPKHSNRCKGSTGSALKLCTPSSQH